MHQLQFSNQLHVHTHFNSINAYIFSQRIELLLLLPFPKYAHICMHRVHNTGIQETQSYTKRIYLEAINTSIAWEEEKKIPNQMFQVYLATAEIIV